MEMEMEMEMEKGQEEQGSEKGLSTLSTPRQKRGVE